MHFLTIDLFMFLPFESLEVFLLSLQMANSNLLYGVYATKTCNHNKNYSNLNFQTCLVETTMISPEEENNISTS